jgi:hypothetical protein
MFAYNAPTFLFSNGAFKILVENQDRDMVYTFPFGDGDFAHLATNEKHRDFIRSTPVYKFKSTAVENGPLTFSEDDHIFLDFIAICLLGTVGRRAPESTQVTEAAVRSKEERSRPASAQSDQTQPGSSSAESSKPSPSFIEGYDDNGLPIRRHVLVLDQKDADQIWETYGLERLVEGYEPTEAEEFEKELVVVRSDSTLKLGENE